MMKKVRISFPSTVRKYLSDSHKCRKEEIVIKTFKTLQNICIVLIYCTQYLRDGPQVNLIYIKYYLSIDLFDRKGFITILPILKLT